VRESKTAGSGTTAAIRCRVTRARSAHATDPLPESHPESTIGAYSVLAPLGRGGSAGVFLARHATSGDHVALKILDRFYIGHEDMVARLFAEREISRRVNHPGLLTVRDSGYSDGGVPFIAMEYLDGESLAELIERVDLDVDAIVGICAQVATAIASLHAVQIAHCDLKPENVFLLYDGGCGAWPRVKVIDYGIARRLDLPPAEDIVAGTPAFMAPEQWRGAPSAASDVYGLGCLLFELVTRQPLFSGCVPRMMQQHCEQRPDRPSSRRIGVPETLERLIVRMLAKDPETRPSMVEVAQELELEVELQRWLDNSVVLEATG
jgi:serine/threonine protein kinase